MSKQLTPTETRKIRCSGAGGYPVNSAVYVATIDEYPELIKAPKFHKETTAFAEFRSFSFLSIVTYDSILLQDLKVAE